MSAPRFRFAVPIALLLLCVPVLTACSGEQVQGIVSDATGGTVDVGGTSVPSDFPEEVPLASGEVVSGNRVGTGTGKVWNVTIQVGDVAAPTTITEQLTAAGFSSTSEIPGAPDIGGTAGFANDNYAVALVVTDNGDGTYAANYTVTAVPQ